jgi:hypothetical protein
LEDFNNGLFDVPTKHRKFVLLRAAGLTKLTSKFTEIEPNIYVVGHRVVYTTKEMMLDNKARLDNGFEGTVLKDPTAPLEFKRTKNVIKLKPTDQETGTILECLPGKGKNAAAKNSDVVKVKAVMARFGKIKDDGYYLHCTTTKSAQLVKALNGVVRDANDRRISRHLGKNIVSYRYSARLGRFLVETQNGEQVYVGGKMTHKAGSDQRMEFWQRREELVGMKIDYVFQSELTQVAKARFNHFHRLREDLS